MHALALGLIALVAVLHAGFLVLEMFLWDHPFGRGTFKMSPEFSAASRRLAANQGLYNGFLAAGLAWALVANRTDIAVFFLSCVVVAGVFGAATVSVRILFIQALPAVLALVAVLVGA